MGHPSEITLNSKSSCHASVVKGAQLNSIMDSDQLNPSTIMLDSIYSSHFMVFNLKQIAAQTALEVSSTEKCVLQHTKSAKEFLGGV